MEGYDEQYLCKLMFYRAVSGIRSWITGIWTEFLVVSSSPRWQTIFKFYNMVRAKSLTVTKHV